MKSFFTTALIILLFIPAFAQLLDKFDVDYDKRYTFTQIE